MIILLLGAGKSASIGVTNLHSVTRWVRGSPIRSILLDLKMCPTPPELQIPILVLPPLLLHSVIFQNYGDLSPESQSPNCISAHRRIHERDLFKRWQKSHQKAKSSLSPPHTSIFKICQLLQQLSLQWWP